MAKKKKTKQRTRKRRAPARRTKSNSSHWLSMCIGLAAGLGIAAIIWYQMRPPAPLPGTQSAATQPVTKQPTQKEDDKPRKRVKPSPIEATGDGFDFYDMLPEQEVIVSDDFANRRNPVAERPPVTALTEPGEYIIQAGSFRSETDAERMKATLGLQGMQANIVGVVVNGQKFHRVRIGPIRELNEVNEFRRRLRESAIDVILIRVR